MPPIELLEARLPAGFRGGFTSRRGGVSEPPFAAANLAGHVGDRPTAVDRNRELFAGALGVGPPALRFAEQVHGARVTVVDRGSAREPATGADGLVTADPAVVLVVLAADCLPVLLADPAAGVGAAVHAGRQGLLAGVLPAAVAAMLDLGARPERIVGVVGPGICASCYELPEEVVQSAAASLPEAVARTPAGTASLDLAAGAAASLGSVGVGGVEQLCRCTREEPDTFFSYRAAGVTGRHAGYLQVAG